MLTPTAYAHLGVEYNAPETTKQLTIED